MVGTTTYEIMNKKIPSSFHNYKIVQISDLHNAEYGKDNASLIRILQSEEPDMIAITGDLVDSNHTDLDVAVRFIQQAIKIAPCYYVTGNHEAWIGDNYDSMEEKLIALGVVVPHNQTVQLEKDGETIQLIGIDDPDFAKAEAISDLSSGMIASELASVTKTDDFKILLSHRPEAFEIYAKENVDCVLSGHAHGGQFRIPFLGGVVAPNQGIFPQYDAGDYHLGTTTMIVSRGIGNSIIPVRFNNRPEVVVIQLVKE